VFTTSLDKNFQNVKTTGIGTGINTTPMIDPINKVWAERGPKWSHAPKWSLE